LFKRKIFKVLSDTESEDMNWVKLYGGCSRIMNHREPRHPQNNSACPTQFKQTLTDLLGLTAIVRTSIDKYFPFEKTYAPFVSVMPYTASISPIVYIYLKYIEYYPGAKISLDDVFSLNNLKDLYLQYNLDWRSDPTLAAAIAEGIM